MSLFCTFFGVIGSLFCKVGAPTQNAYVQTVAGSAHLQAASLSCFAQRSEAVMAENSKRGSPTGIMVQGH